MLTPDDLELYQSYLKLVSSQDGLRVILSYPDDYIALLSEVKRLREDISSLRRYQNLYMDELLVNLLLQDKLHAIARYCNDNNFRLPFPL